MKLYDLGTSALLALLAVSYIGSVGVRVEEPKTVKEIAVVVKADAKKVEDTAKKVVAKAKEELKKVVPSTEVIINE
jgi:transcription initiation factor TFIIIB Brf1 subunit/transcription initiation factor TFIIB